MNLMTWDDWSHIGSLSLESPLVLLVSDSLWLKIIQGMYENNQSCFAGVLFTTFNKKCLWMSQWFTWRIFIRGFNPRSFRDKTFIFVNNILIEVTFIIDFLFLTNIMYNLNWFIFNKITDLKKTVWNYLSNTIKSLINTSSTGFLNWCFLWCFNFFLFFVLNFLSLPYLSYTSWQLTALPRWWIIVLLPPINLLQKFTLIWVRGDKFDILLKLKEENWLWCLNCPPCLCTYYASSNPFVSFANSGCAPKEKEKYL